MGMVDYSFLKGPQPSSLPSGYQLPAALRTVGWHMAGESRAGLPVEESGLCIREDWEEQETAGRHPEKSPVKKSHNYKYSPG